MAENVTRGPLPDVLFDSERVWKGCSSFVPSGMVATVLDSAVRLAREDLAKAAARAAQGEIAALPGDPAAVFIGMDMASGPDTAATALVSGGELVAVAALGLPAVLADVLDELRRATSKFPTWPTDPLHAISVVGEEHGETVKAVLQAVYEPHKSTPADVRLEAIQLAAMAIRFLMSMDRYTYSPGPQHGQEAEERTP